jgi:hypothetical protein
MGGHIPAASPFPAELLFPQVDQIQRLQGGYMIKINGKQLYSKRSSALHL